MSSAVVPYEQMEKMAKTVAASKLFGIQQPEQALALMALCQAEGIHPMTAVRDYHIVNNRPSLKAETMLARFHQAGGRVRWYELSDAKADAEFSHPQGGTIRLDWTIERANQAGLMSNPTWKKYPRAMLRSRLVSEGVRTVCPQVVQGVYLEDEIINSTPELGAVSVEQGVQSFGTAQLTNAEAEVYVEDISSAPTLEALRDNFSAAWRHNTDEKRRASLKLAYDARKAELEEQAMSAAIEAQKEQG